jgi:hypothetical protein
MHRTKKLAASVFASAVMAVAVVVPAGAAQQQQDGLVNVAIGDITIQDVNVGVAANIAANVCGIAVGPVAVLGRAVDRSGDDAVVCGTGDQAVRLLQN